MSIRVSHLAEELGVSTAQLIPSLKDLGVESTGPSDTVDEDTAALVRELLATQPVGAVNVPDDVPVKDLAEILGVQPAEIQKILLDQGVFASLNHVVAFNQSEKIAATLGVPIQKGASHAPVTPKPKHKPQHSAKATFERAPVVTVLGHVDHGKTSLLDVIRNTRVTDGEFGGITQHIGAYQVVRNGKMITFIDTPGHAAFTAMRKRGAQVTDIAVLVVAADDGVMPQTKEAIDHARAAGVPIIVAMNKIDKAEANPDRVKQQLAELELIPEEWGGDTMVVPVSATENQGIDDLLERILLQAEILELTGDPASEPEGVVIESRLERGRGPVATVLVQNGTLKVGQSIVVGSTHGKIKAMLDDKGVRIQKAGPATPVELLGLVSVPNAGDTLVIANDERSARQMAGSRADKDREERLGASAKVSLDDLYRKLKQGEAKELNLILRCDADGSVEAIKQTLSEQSTDEVAVRVLQSSVGNVGAGDIVLAAASDAIVIGFNVKVDREATEAAEKERVELRQYNIIYELLDDVRKAMGGLLEPEQRQEIIGHAEIRQLFKTPAGMIAGSYVQDGKFQRNALARLTRDGEQIYEGKIESLRRFKDDVREVATGYECGIQLAGYNDLQEGDIVEAYVINSVARTV